MSDVFKQARNVPIHEVLESRHVLSATARDKYACVACASSDAMHVYKVGNNAHCFSCGESFSPIDIIMNIDGVEALPAAKTLVNENDLSPRNDSSRFSKRVNTQAAPEPGELQPPAKTNSRDGTRRRVLNEMYPYIDLGIAGANYLSGRGIDPSLASSLGIGEGDGRHWYKLTEEFSEDELEAAGLLNSRGNIHPFYSHGFLIFTYFTSDGGSVDSYRFRRLYDDNSQKMLALCGPGPKHPYLASVSVPQAQKSTQLLYVVEGELDALSILQTGRHAVATPGASVWKDEWCKGWESLRVVVLADGDEAGRGLAARIAKSAHRVQGRNWVKQNLNLRAPSAEGVDPNDLLQHQKLSQQLSKIEHTLSVQ